MSTIFLKGQTRDQRPVTSNQRPVTRDQQMKRFGQTIQLKPEGEEAYKKYHAEAWPGVLKMIKECNIQNYSIWCRGLTLFAYFEYVGNDFEADMARMASDPETRRWWNTVKPLMQPFEDRKPEEFWSNMEEIFYFTS